jgi:hypothetical protein
MAFKFLESEITWISGIIKRMRSIRVSWVSIFWLLLAILIGIGLVRKVVVVVVAGGINLLLLIGQIFIQAF